MTANGWHDPDLDVGNFLAAFALRSAGAQDGADDDAGRQFHDPFIAADPRAAHAVPRALFVASLPARRALFARAGVGETALVRAVQLDLDDAHVVVSTEWDAARQDGDPLRLESTFLLRRESEGLQILVYLNHRDVLALLGPT